MAVTQTFIGSFSMLHLGLVVLAGLACSLLIRLTPSAPRLAGSPAIMRAVQAAHLKPTPRVGGLAIFGAMVTGLLFLPAGAVGGHEVIILAGGLLFATGLIEDLGFGVSPRKRLIAAAVSSLLVIMFLEMWLPVIGIPQLEWIMNYWFVAIPLTLLLTVGVANAFNLIDGVNGLAAFTAITAAAAMALIAIQAGYFGVLGLATLLLACVFGFLVFNYPLGKIFLGDAGAYSLGFVISWLAITILVNAPEVTPWALLLTVFWPIMDLSLAVYRRQAKKTDKMLPDRLHVHQLVMRSLEIFVLGRNKRRIANPLTTLVLAPLVIMPAATGVLFWNEPALAFSATIFFATLFVGSYFLAFRSMRHWERKSQCPKRSAD